MQHFFFLYFPDSCWHLLLFSYCFTPTFCPPGCEFPNKIILSICTSYYYIWSGTIPNICPNLIFVIIQFPIPLNLHILFPSSVLSWNGSIIYSDILYFSYFHTLTLRMPFFKINKKYVCHIMHLSRLLLP